MKERLNGLLDQAEAFLMRHDLPTLARKAGRALMKAAGRPVPTPDTSTSQGGGAGLDRVKRLTAHSKPAMVSTSPEQSAPETDGDSRPGF